MSDKMNTFHYISHRLIALMTVVVLMSTVATAAPRFSVATGNWNATSTWSATSGGAAGASVPVAGDAVTIERGFNVTVTADAACTSITFTTTTATSLTISSGITLNVSGAITIPRSGAGVNLIAVGAGILNAGSVAFTNGGGGVRHQITISTGTVNVTGGVTTDNTGASASITFTGAGFLKVGGASLLTTPTNGGTLTTVAGSTVEYNGAGAQTCKVATYSGNLTLSGSGVKTFATTPTVNGILSMQGTATVTVTTGVVTYGAAATLQYNTTSARTASAEEWITPFAATGGIVIASTGTITLNAAKVVNAPLTINNGATLATGNFALNVGGNWTNNGNFNVGTSTVTFSRAGYTIGGTSSTTFGPIIIAAGATRTMNNNNSCTGLTFAAGGTASSLTHGGTSTSNS